ncbi:MAG: P-II family nitrogen regulator [Candidatus Nitrosotenuis sp.]
MKRIDAIIQEDKLDVVTDALKEIGITGITITQSRGIGTGERPVLRGSRGTAKFVAMYNRLDVIMTVVDDSKVGRVVKAIMDSAHTGTAGDGKIFVSNVDEAFDIATKQSGTHIL